MFSSSKKNATYAGLLLGFLTANLVSQTGAPQVVQWYCLSVIWHAIFCAITAVVSVQTVWCAIQVDSYKMPSEILMPLVTSLVIIVILSILQAYLESILPAPYAGEGVSRMLEIARELS